MILLWPWFLALLAIIPPLAAGYWWAQRRKRRQTLRYSSLVLIQAALPRQSRLKKYLPPALYLVALASLIIAEARPAVVTTFATSQPTMVLVMDVSGSMGAKDIQPTRLAAAQEAALSFVRGQKVNMQIGIVAFSGSAQIVQLPTADREQVEASIQSLTVGDNTAIGSGIYEALNIIALRHKKVLPPPPDARYSDQSPWAGPSSPGPAPSQKLEHKSEILPEIIVLLTDGRNNIGPLPTDVAQIAENEGVRIYTIGYGPEYDSSPNKKFFDRKKLIPDTGGGYQKYNDYESIYNAVAVRDLREVANLTGGKDYTATNAGDLEKVLANLPIQWTVRKETQEISTAFVALGALLAVGALMLGGLWHPLP